MSLYRKKPAVIEATVWFKNGDHPLDWRERPSATELFGLISRARQALGDWEGQVVRRFRHPSEIEGPHICQHCGGAMHTHGWIDTLEGGHIVCPGDWIITDVKGERYPCKPDVFAATYEPA